MDINKQKIYDGTLRWIITPKKGKVYFLSPIYQTGLPKFLLQSLPSYIPSNETPIPFSCLKSNEHECVLTQNIYNKHYCLYFNKKIIDKNIRSFIGPKFSIKGDIGILILSDGKQNFYLNGKKVFNVKEAIEDWHFGPGSELAWVTKSDQLRKFYVNGKLISPLNDEKFILGFISKRRQIAIQIIKKGRGRVLVNNKVVSLKKAEEIGSWQFTPNGKVIIAQKVKGKWGVYNGDKLLSPRLCDMVWGWQYTDDNHFIVPVEYQKGDNLILLKDNEIVYVGKGNLITWYYRKNNLWVLAEEDGQYKIFYDGKLKESLGCQRGSLKSWQVNSLNQVAIEYVKNQYSGKDTPKTCHPLKDFVASNEWWFGKHAPIRFNKNCASAIKTNNIIIKNRILDWKLLDDGRIYWDKPTGLKLEHYLNHQKTNKLLWLIFKWSVL